MLELIASTLLLAASVASAQESTPDDLVYRALSVRHAAPSCAEVEALTPTPIPTLLRMVDEAHQPPWVGMRAADCLVLRHHESIGDRLDQWVVDPELRGLGLLVINRLDALPLALAQSLASRALAQGPDPEQTRERLGRLSTPELKRLAEVTP